MNDHFAVRVDKGESLISVIASTLDFKSINIAGLSLLIAISVVPSDVYRTDVHIMKRELS